MADPLELERTTFFPAFKQGGPRSAGSITVVVIHDTEGVTGPLGAEATAAYFHSPAATAGTQLVVDDDSTQRCIDDLVIPAGVPPLNTHGLHIEQSGHAAWSTGEWLAHESMIDRCAFKVAQWCAKFAIPAVWLEVADLKAAPGFPQPSPKGITSHANVTLAWGQSTHTDPGPNYPYDLFMQKVKDFLAPPGGGDDWVAEFTAAEIKRLHEMAAGDQLPGFRAGMIQGFNKEPVKPPYTGPYAEAGRKLLDPADPPEGHPV